jgi:hypothetical protein
MIETLVSLAIVVLVVGLLFYLIGLAPIDGRLKAAFYAIAIVVVLIYLLRTYL